MKFMIQALWDFRGFVLGSIRREFQIKYRNSLLGALWTIINPLAMIVVYTVIFSQIMRAKLPGIDSQFAYSIYLCAGVLTWGLFSEILGRMQNVFIDNANLLKKISFPRICLPFIVIGSAVVNFSIILGIFCIFLLITGNFPGWPIVAIFPVLAILIAFAVGLGVVVGVLNVFFRDVGQMFSVVLQFWFWLTPVVYTINIIPEKMQGLMQLNPAAAIISAFQRIFVEGLWPQWPSLIWVAVLSVFLCFLGLRLFSKHSGEMVDEL